MQDSLRNTGIDIIGNVPWGTNLCQFFMTRYDLLDIMVPFFKAGLENNELCIWVSSESPITTGAQQVIKTASDLAEYYKKGRMEILTSADLHPERSTFDSWSIINVWLEKLKLAQSRGFSGIRLAGEIFQANGADQNNIGECEAGLHRILAYHNILSLCTFHLDRYQALDFLDIIRNHEFTLIKQGGIWERIEKSISPRAIVERFRGLVDKFPDIIARFDRNMRCTYINPAIGRLNGLSSHTFIGKTSEESGMPRELAVALDKGFQNVVQTGRIKRLQCVIPSLLGPRYLQLIIIPEFDKNDDIINYSCITRDITELQEAKNALVKIKDDLELKFQERTSELSEREQQITRIFETTGEGIVLADIGGDIIRANAAAIKLLRLEPDKLHEQSLHLPYWEIPARWAVLNPDGTPMHFNQNPLARAIVDKQITRNVEFGIKFEDGSITWVNTSTAPFISPAGRVEGIVFTFTDITEQKRLRDEKEQFTRKLIEVQEEERNRISRELHDDTAQWLALLTLEIDDIVDRGNQIPEDTITRLRKLRKNTENALQEVRRFSHELRPTVLEHFGLAAALELIISEFNSTSQPNKTEASLKISGIEKRLSKEIELVLFRIAQESLSNIRKHARAARAMVTVKYSAKTVSLSISDNGCGFNAKSRPTPEGSLSSGLGLVGMRERAYLIGGRFYIKSIPGKGTSVSIKVPVNSHSIVAETSKQPGKPRNGLPVID